jgi:hypothetical protein
MTHAAHFDLVVPCRTARTRTSRPDSGAHLDSRFSSRILGLVALAAVASSAAWYAEARVEAGPTLDPAPLVRVVDLE